MGSRDKEILKPLFEKHLKNKKIYGFDIETTGTNNDFYMGGLYSEEGYKSFYTKEDFLKELQQKKYYKNTYLTATNLSFDLTGLFYNTKYWNHLNIIINGGRLIFATLTNKQKQRLTFTDTFSYAPLSVKVMGEILNIKKLPSPKCLGRIPKNEEERIELEKYNQRDCEVTYYFMKFLQEGFYNAGGKTKTTIASTALDIYRRKYLRRSIKREKEKQAKKLIYESYYGGRTEVFKRGKIRNLKLYDINSLYPSVMIKEYPDPNTYQYTSKGSMDIINKYEGVTKVTIQAPKKLLYPLLPYRANKLIFPLGTFTSTYTHIELRKAIKIGYEIKNIHESIYYKKTFYPFKEYVIDLYNKRLEMKRINSPQEIVYKLLLNSLYGKFAQKNLQENIFFNKEYLSDEQIENLRCRDGVFMKDDNNGVIITNKTCDESFVLPILSSYTTSYARLKLYDYLVKGDAYYCDTDSIITSKTLRCSNKLGDMKLEYTIKDGILIKPKMYYLKTVEKGDIIKLKGVPKRILFKNVNQSINFEVLQSVLNGEVIRYEKFVKLKEGVRRNLLPNSLIETEKFINLNDDKRLWNGVFDSSNLQESEPLCLMNQ